jgi:hypothetical protein
LFPYEGPTSGGATVTVYGRNFISSASLACSFGTSASLALYITSTQIQCLSTSGSAGTVSVEVSNNNQQFSTQYTSYTYYGMITMMG